MYLFKYIKLYFIYYNIIKLFLNFKFLNFYSFFVLSSTFFKLLSISSEKFFEILIIKISEKNINKRLKHN